MLAPHKHGRAAETKPAATIFTHSCPFKGHPSRPQTLFKSSEDQTGKHSVTAQCDRVLISYRCAAVQSMQEVRAGIPPTVVNDT